MQLADLSVGPHLAPHHEAAGEAPRRIVELDDERRHAVDAAEVEGAVHARLPAQPQEELHDALDPEQRNRLADLLERGPAFGGWGRGGWSGRGAW